LLSRIALEWPDVVTTSTLVHSRLAAILGYRPAGSAPRSTAHRPRAREAAVRRAGHPHAGADPTAVAETVPSMPS